MIIQWTSHLPTEDRQTQFKNEVLGSKRVLERLSQILIEEEQKLGRAEINPKNYDTPSWSHKQAHANGFKQCLSVVQTIINLDQQKEVQ